MYLIGGTMNGRDYVCSQMSRLDLQTLNWDVIQTRGSAEMPNCMDEHSACCENGKVYTFGGFEDGERVNTVHTFDLETHTWATITPIAAANAPAPKPRAGHTASLYQGSLYIFGGKDDENEKLNDMWKFDIAAKTWSKIVSENKDTVPSPRSGHTATLFQGYICVFGGIFEVTKELNDVHLFDIEGNRWICLFSANNEPGSAQSPTKAMASGNASPL